VSLPDGFNLTPEQAYHMEQVLRGNATEINKTLKEIDKGGDAILNKLDKALKDN
jgi:hypothetical protein